MSMSATRHLNQFLRPKPTAAAEEEDESYLFFLLNQYISHMGIVLQRMIVNKRAIQEHLNKGDTLFLLSAPDNTHKELLFLLNHAHLDTVVEPWLGIQSSKRTKLRKLVTLPDFNFHLSLELAYISKKVQNFVQNKQDKPVFSIFPVVYVLNSHIEVYASATANI